MLRSGKISQVQEIRAVPQGRLLLREKTQEARASPKVRRKSWKAG